MPKLKVDLSGSDPEKATGRNFEPAKPGTYAAKIVEVDQTEAKSSGNQMLVFTYEITQPGSEKGKKLWDRAVLTDTAMWKLDQILQAVGMASKKKRKLNLDTDDLIGESLSVTVKRGEYEGNPTAEVARVAELADDDDEDWDEEEDDEEEFDEEDDEDEEDELDDEDDDELDDDEDDDDEDDEDEESYEDWSVKELRTELKERGLKTQGAKPSLIARLEENDEEPF